MARCNIGPCNVILYDGIHYQAQEYFQPVDCKHIECVKEDTKDSCPFHSDSQMQGDISQLMMDLDREETDRKDMEAMTGRKEGGKKSVMQKLKVVFRAIAFDEYP